MYIKRINRLRHILNKINLDAIFVSNFYNILYLTGFKTLSENEREAYVLVTKSNIYLFTDARYLTENSQFSTLNFQLRLIESGKGIFSHLKEIVEEEKILRLGIEADDLKVTEYQRLKKVFPKIGITSTEKIIIKIREIKDDSEIEKISRACQITDECLKYVSKEIKVGISEKEIALKIEDFIKKAGAEPAFAPIVAVDENSAIPHYDTRGGTEKVKNNSVILLDFGAKYKDYNSDITRMIFINPETGVLNIYATLLSIQEKTIEEIGKNKDPKEIDIICRKGIDEHNLPKIPHSIGHGIGLEVHEFPKISLLSQDKLMTSQVFTIEPGVYFQGKWGMRIEDTIYINEDGQPKILTLFSKEPLIFRI